MSDIFHTSGSLFYITCSIVEATLQDVGNKIQTIKPSQYTSILLCIFYPLPMFENFQAVKALQRSKCNNYFMADAKENCKTNILTGITLSIDKFSLPL